MGDCTFGELESYEMSEVLTDRLRWWPQSLSMVVPSQEWQVLLVLLAKTDIITKDQ